MGIGSSGMQGEYRQKRRYPPSKYGSYGGKKQKHGHFFKKTGLQSTPQSVQPVIPMQPYSQYNPAFGPYPYMQRPVPAYGPIPQPQAYSGYMPMNYNNYSNPPNVYYQQPPPPPPPPPPPQMPVYQPSVIPQPVPVAQPMPYSTYSPYAYPPPPPPPAPAAAAYPTGTPYSAPYVQPQAAAQPVYTNMYSAPAYPAGGSFGGSSFTSSGPYRQASGQLSTDWTGGGKISPGFLGPPI